MQEKILSCYSLKNFIKSLFIFCSVFYTVRITTDCCLHIMLIRVMFQAICAKKHLFCSNFSIWKFSKAEIYGSSVFWVSFQKRVLKNRKHMGISFSFYNTKLNWNSRRYFFFMVIKGWAKFKKWFDFPFLFRITKIKTGNADLGSNSTEKWIPIRISWGNE